MKKYLPYLIFAVLTILIMLPLYQGGFVFLLDMVFTPQLNLADYLTQGMQANFPLILIIKALSYVLPLDIIQKIILSLILFLPGVFMYQLVQKLENKETGKEIGKLGNKKTEIEIKKQRNRETKGNTFFLPLVKKFSVSQFLSFLISISAGLFYMLNPWVYQRFLAGHWLVLLGYAFFPLIVKLFLQTLHNFNTKNFIKFALLFSIYPIINLHWAYIATIFLIILLIAYLIQNRNSITYFFHQKKKLKTLSFSISLFLGFFILINSFWLINFFSSTNTFTKIQLNDFAVYQTQSDPVWGPYFNVLSLYGFWQTDYFLPKDALNYWWILTFLTLFFLSIGIYQVFKNKNILGMTLAILFIPVLLIAVGYTHWFTQPIIKFLYHSLPGFKGLRETGKLIGLLAFSYALLVPIGAKTLARLLHHIQMPRLCPSWLKPHMIIYIVVLLIPILSVHNIFLAFNHQLKTSDYPAAWYQANQILKKTDPASSHLGLGKVLFLPWHGYPRLSFANHHRISNPAQRFFDPPVIAGQNIDNVYLLTTDQGVWDQKIFQLVQGFQSLDDNLEFLKSQHISHIILAHEHDSERYTFLQNSQHLKPLLTTPALTLYVIQY